MDSTTMPSADLFAGCILGLATGDALGAPHEGGPLERFLWRLIGKTPDGCLRWTDDTQMTLDLAKSLLEQGGVEPAAIASRFASSYRWSRGYGPGTARVLKRIRREESWERASKAVYPEGSYGNGAAMRSPVLALFFPTDRKGLLEATRESAIVTHAHPLAIEGAVLIALATQALLRGKAAPEILDGVRGACTDPKMLRRLALIASWIERGEVPGARSLGARSLAKELGHGPAALESCPTALYIALRHLNAAFEEMIRFTIDCGGDVDTIGAMAGALWGVTNGAQRLPPIRLEAREELSELANRLYRRHTQIQQLN